MKILKIYKKSLKKIFRRLPYLTASFLTLAYHQLNCKTGLEDFLLTWTRR